jgi:DNA-binding response OmpR family regulator
MDDASTPYVVIADDCISDVQLLERALRRQGYSGVVAVSSLDEVRDQLEATEPGVLIVGLGLLVRDQYALLRQLRGSARWVALPVLIVVSGQPVPMIKAAVLAGASGFITKPFNGVEIAYKVGQSVRGVRARAAERADLCDGERTTGTGG